MKQFASLLLLSGAIADPLLSAQRRGLSIDTHFCDNRNVQKYAHPEHDSYYYECNSKHDTAIKYCPPITWDNQFPIFDETTQDCVALGTYGLRSEPSSCDDMEIECCNTETPVNFCSNKKDGMYAKENTQTEYVMCYDGTPYCRSCHGEGFVWDDIKKMCVHDIKCICVPDSFDPNWCTKNGKTNGFYAVDEGCSSQYYQCEDELTTCYKCPLETAWENYWVGPDGYGYCHTCATTPAPTTTTVTTTTVTPHDTCKYFGILDVHLCIGKAAGRYYTYDCDGGHYYECINEVAWCYICDCNCGEMRTYGWAFYELKQRCDYADVNPICGVTAAPPVNPTAVPQPTGSLCHTYGLDQNFCMGKRNGNYPVNDDHCSLYYNCWDGATYCQSCNLMESDGKVPTPLFKYDVGNPEWGTCVRPGEATCPPIGDTYGTGPYGFPVNRPLDDPVHPLPIQMN